MDAHRLLAAIPFVLLILSFVVVTKELVTMDEAEFSIWYPEYQFTFGAGHPGYAMPLWILTNIFDPATTLKTVSFLAGLLTLCYTHKFATKYVGKREGIMSIYLLLGLPLFWFHSLIGEVYAPTALALILFLYLMFEKRFYAAGLSLGMAVAIQEAAGLLVFPFVYLLFKKAKAREAIGSFLASGIFPVLGYGYIIRRWGFPEWARNVFPFRSWFFDFPYQAEVQSMDFLTRFAYNVKMTGLTVNLVGLLAILSLFAYKGLNSEKRLVFRSLILMLLPLFFYPFMPVTDAYPTLVMIYPFLAILGAIGLSRLVQLFNLRKVVWILLFVFLSVNFFVQPMSFLLSGNDHPTLGLVDRVNALAEPDSCIYSCLAGSGEEKFFLYYFPELTRCEDSFTEHSYVTSNCASGVGGNKQVVERLHFDNVPYPWIAKDYEIYKVSG